MRGVAEPQGEGHPYRDLAKNSGTHTSPAAGTPSTSPAAPLFGHGVGHHSPIGAYLADEDRARREREVQAVAGDNRSKQKRGLLRIE